ncbi:tyrosine-type recombinase/integrase [Microbacterium invictum]|uniref:Integrase n=1 Tax=Microbacterium invictum TaxID=515415 RepID=A0AA40SR88_9MICO|nr:MULTISPECIES: site-specific integrase [Microbacterium]MBB4140844.1 integrase [Microbacterium invictum]
MPKARDHGQGALYWVASRGMWKAVLDVGFDPYTGKRLQKGLYSKTKDGAVKKLNTMLRERESLGRVLDRSTRVSDLADRWLDDVSHRAKPSTIANYRSNVRAKIAPVLGRRLISELTPTDIRRMHAAIRASGAGDASVSSAHRTLVTMLEFARAERISTENVAMLTPPRRAQPGKKRESLTREEAKALLALNDARWTLGLLTGLRSGEARALRWEDIDFKRGVARLSWSLTGASFVHGCGGTCGKKTAGACPQRKMDISDDLEWIPLQDRHVLVRPKNGTPREIPIPKDALKQLQDVAQFAVTPNPHSLVWHRADGSPKTNTDDNQDLRAALLAAGIDRPAATTHWLRHSYVTLSEHAGVPWAAFSGVSGHGSTEASDPYRHVLTTEGRRAVDSLTAWVAQ